MDGAVHVCQTMGVCDAFRSGRLFFLFFRFFYFFSKKGLDWFPQVHLWGVRPGPWMGGELHRGPDHDRRVRRLPRTELLPRCHLNHCSHPFILLLNFLLSDLVSHLVKSFYLPDDWEGCKEHAIQDFPAMHNMAMEKFFIPTEIWWNVNSIAFS